MKELLIACLSATLLCGAIAETIPEPGAADARIRVVTYNPRNVVRLNTFFGVSTHIKFSESEQIKDVAVGDDLAWKVMKDILVQYYAITGFVAGSPREVLRESFKAELIQGDEWMDMLKVRNQLAHDYDGVIVKKYCHIIVDEYIGKFEEFQSKVDVLLEEI